MKKSLLFLFLGLMVGYSLSSYINTSNTPQEPSKVVSQVEMQKTKLEHQFPYTKSSVNAEEEKSILATVLTFETHQANRDGKAVLNMFTAPSNDKEQHEYDFLTSKDLVHLQPATIRMYGTAGLSFDLNWYYITDIIKKGKVYIVQVKELRTSYDNSEGGYYANHSELIIEFVRNSSGEIKIDKYYRKVPVVTASNLTKKYDGFY